MPGGSPKRERKISDDMIRPDCQVVFDNLDKTLQTVNGTLETFRSEVSNMGERISAQEETTKGIWKEIREDLHPTIRAIPGAIVETFEKHEGKCLARRKIEASALKDSNPPQPSSQPAPNPAPVPQVVAIEKVSDRKTIAGIPSTTLIRWLFYFGLVIGGAIAGGSGFSLVFPN